MTYLFKFMTGSKVHGSFQDPETTDHVFAWCGKWEVAWHLRERNILIVAEEDLCGTCFVPHRMEIFRRMKNEAYDAVLDPIDSLDVHEARDALRQVRRRLDEVGELSEADFEHCLAKPVSGTLTITIDLFNLHPRVAEYEDHEFAAGFDEVVMSSVRDDWESQSIDLCWWTDGAKEHPFSDAAEVSSVEFELHE